MSGTRGSRGDEIDLFTPARRVPRRVRAGDSASGALGTGADAHRRDSPTADRGRGAAAPRTAREAVRQEAVRHGGDDPTSEWTQRRRAFDRRARTEHAACATDHPSMMEFTAGSRTVAPKPVNLFGDFERRVSDAVGRTEHRHLDAIQAHLFCRAHGIGQVVDQASGRVVTTVDRGGYRFQAVGEDLGYAVAALGRIVGRGPDAAIGPTPPTADTPAARTAPRDRSSPEAELKSAAVLYFSGRKQTLHRYRAKDIAFGVNDKDREWATRLGVVVTPDMDATALYLAVDAVLASHREELHYGLTKDLLPGESLERVRDLTGAAEQRRTDRYIDRPVARGPRP